MPRDLAISKHQASGKFDVSILFWTDIWQDLTKDETRLFQHYPQLRPKQAEPKLTHDERLFREFQAVLPFEPAIRLLREHDFGGSFAKAAVRPLMDFVETWDQPEKKFLDSELQEALTNLYKAAYNMGMHVAGKTVPIGNMEYLSVYSDHQRAVGPRPSSVIEDARILNEDASRFVQVYKQFLHLCRRKLAG